MERLRSVKTPIDGVRVGRWGELPSTGIEYLRADSPRSCGESVRISASRGFVAVCSSLVSSARRGEAKCTRSSRRLDFSADEVLEMGDICLAGSSSGPWVTCNGLDLSDSGLLACTSSARIAGCETLLIPGSSPSAAVSLVTTCSSGTAAPVFTCESSKCTSSHSSIAIAFV
eukprot:scaffold296903_cov27-Tisochrysis_lutea.AAC.1